MVFTHKHLYVISVPLINLLLSFSSLMHLALNWFRASLDLVPVCSFHGEDSQENYTDTCLFFSAYILFTLPNYIVDSLVHVLTLCSPEKLVCQWRNRGFVSFGSHVESWTVYLARNWYPVTFHGMSRTHENACHFSQWFSPVEYSYASTPGPTETGGWKGGCGVTDGEQKYVLCLRHQWRSRMWPWTLPQRSGGGWILHRGTWCWRTTGTWSRSVRMGSHRDSGPCLRGHHYLIDNEVA